MSNSNKPGTLKRVKLPLPRGWNRPQSEQPTSHCVNKEVKVVESPIYSNLTGETDTVLMPVHETLSELSAEVAESEQLSETAEQEFSQDPVETSEADSTIDSDDEVLPKYKKSAQIAVLSTIFALYSGSQLTKVYRYSSLGTVIYQNYHEIPELL